MTTENIMLSAALYYAAMKLPVLPLKPGGKTPLTEHGCKDATTDVGRIALWWGLYPDANIGIATGAGECPLCVLDIDINHEGGKYGDDSLDELIKQYGPLPETWLCLTGGGGLHYYFYCDDPAVTVGADLLPGIDFRGSGGYVVAPPSRHESGNLYEWEASNDPHDGAAAAKIPDWLHNLFINGKPQRAKRKQESAPESIIQGSRNQEIFRLAASLRSKGLTVEEITAAMLEANKTRCKPPLSDKEVMTICNSVGRYERGDTASQGCFNPEKAKSLKPDDYSDAGNAEVFCRVCEKDLIYVDALGWLSWNGTNWERNEHQPMIFARKLSAHMLNEAVIYLHDINAKQSNISVESLSANNPDVFGALKAAESETSSAKAFLKHAQKLRNAVQLRNMVDLSKHSMVIKADRLDANPLELNTPAGIVNLSTGQIRPHDREAYCSQITSVSPSKDGMHMWSEFLDTISCGDKSISEFLQMVSGMALIGSVYHEGVVIAYGGGRNGKSTFFNTLGAVMGDYSGGIDIKALTTDRGNKGAALAMLRGKRLVVTGELEEYQRLSSSVLKQVASTDTLVIEEKYKAPEVIKQSHTLVIFTNFLPHVGSTDGGTWRRLLVIPFNAVIPEYKGVQNYAEKLFKISGGAVLDWAIEGANKFIRNGFKLKIPEIVRDATAEYQERENWLNNFINERCIKDPNARVGARALYTAYKWWAAEAGERIRNERDFSASMEAAGYNVVRPRGVKYYEGICVVGGGG